MDISIWHQPWPRLVDATKASLICQQLIKLTRAGLPEDKTDWPEELTSYFNLCMDFFQVEATYLAIADRYTNWLSIFRLPKDDSANIITVLRHYFTRWGAAK